MAYHYRRRRGGRQDVVMEPNSSLSSEFDTSSGSEFGRSSSESPLPENIQEEQPPPRPPQAQAPTQEPTATVIYNNSLL